MFYFPLNYQISFINYFVPLSLGSKGKEVELGYGSSLHEKITIMI